jgi:hypothetical protein
MSSSVATTQEPTPEQLAKLVDDCKGPADGRVAAFTALLNACCSEKCVLAVSATALPVCATALAESPTEEVVVAVTQLLARLFTFTDVATLVASSYISIIEALLTALDQHAGNPSVIEAIVVPIRNLACGGQNVRDALRAASVVTNLEELKQAYVGRRSLTLVLQDVLDAVCGADYDFFDGSLIPPCAGADKASSREELKEPARLLREGDLFQLVSPEPRTQCFIYITDDLKWLVWKDPRTTAARGEQYTVLAHVFAAERGFNVEPEVKTAANADEKRCFTIYGREHVITLEAPTEELCAAWVTALSAFATFHNGLALNA